MKLTITKLMMGLLTIATRLTMGLLVIALGLFAVGAALSPITYCLKGEYVFGGPADSTIQTISRHSYIEGVGDVQSWLIRGHITKFAVVGDHIIGYLSMKHVHEDGLFGLTGEYDKEGYFIIDTRNGKIVSGLSENEADHHIAEAASIKLGSIKFIDYYSAWMRLMCLLPEKWRPSYQ